MGWTFVFPKITELLSAHWDEMNCTSEHIEHIWKYWWYLQEMKLKKEMQQIRFGPSLSDLSICGSKQLKSKGHLPDKYIGYICPVWSVYRSCRSSSGRSSDHRVGWKSFFHLEEMNEGYIHVCWQGFEK